MASHRGRTALACCHPPRGDRSLPLLIVSLLVTTAVSGCLFPPVEPPNPVDVEEEEEEEEHETEDPPRPPGPPATQRRRDDWTQSGMIDRGATLAGQATETDAYTVGLPARLRELFVRLEWEDEGTYDLDLELEALQRGEVVWNRSFDEGDVGTPDQPVEQRFADLPFFDAEDETSMNVIVDAKNAVNVRYVAYLEWVYLSET